MVKELIYGLLIGIGNYGYMRIFTKNLKLSLLRITSYWIGCGILGIIFYMNLFYVNVFGIIVVLFNFFYLFSIDKNYLSAVLFCSFSYAVYHLIWYLLFYSYYGVQGSKFPFPFEGIENVLFFKLLLLMSVSYFIIGYILNCLFQRFNIRNILQELSSSIEAIFISTVFILFLFPLNFFLFLLWEKDYYREMEVQLFFDTK